MENYFVQIIENLSSTNEGAVSKTKILRDSSAIYPTLSQPRSQSADYTTRKYHISQLIDIPLLQQLFCSFYELTGIMHAILDSENNILSTTGWHDICTKFHRICPQTEYRCKESDSYIASHVQSASYVGYKCLNGLNEYATPIIVNGQHLGTIFMGQLFHEEPDEEYFRRQAREYGFDETAYIQALHKVNIVPEKQIEPIMEFYAKLGQVLANMGLQSMKQLEAAEDKFYKAFHCFPDPVTITDIENDQYLEVNNAWIETTGYSKEEALNYTCLELGVWNTQEERDLILTQIQEQGHVRNIETTFRMKSGEIRIFLTSAEIIDIGKKPQLLCVHKDITERKQLEIKLLESEEKFSKIFYNSPDPITITTLDGSQHVEMNDAWMQITGYQRHEALEHSVKDMKIWVVPEEHDQIINKIQTSGPIHNIESKFHKRSGEISTLLVSADIINVGGEPHLLMITKNIDDRKRMEESLRLSEERFSKAFNASPIAMSITALDDGRFIDLNDSVCRIIRCTRQDLLGRTSLEVGFWYDPDDRELMKQRLIANQMVRDQEIYFQTINGERRRGLYTAERLEINNQACVLSLLMDITERKQMEDEMVRLDRLNIVGEMAASIGHEIRNPLTSVRGFLQMFEDKYGEDKENLQLMIDELDRANGIISNFLSLARNKAVELKKSNLNTLINHMYPLLLANAMIQDKTIQILTDNVPDLLIDEKEIRQLLFNLVINGLESMPSGKSLTIRTFLKGTNVVLSIQDQGKGIDLETLNKLGTPFFTTKENGTGLGLAVCFGIASRHNARIDIETKASGTIFSVRFPLEKGKLDTSRKRSQQSNEASGAKQFRILPRSTKR